MLRPTLFLDLTRAAVLVALAASSALWLHYLDPLDAGFCGMHSGCEAVRAAGLFGVSYFAHPALSIPLLGLLAYGTVFALSLLASERTVFAAVTGGGGCMALFLLTYQVLALNSFCWLCVTVDVAAMVAGVGAVLHLRRVRRAEGATPAPSRGLAPGAWLLLSLVATAAPIVWSKVHPAEPVPAAVRALYQPGKLNVIEFADFQCPYCRKLHPVLERLLAVYPAHSVHRVRMNVPLPHHSQARGAARGYVCADAQGRGPQMESRLVEIELEPSSARRVAVELGLDLRAFDACLASATTDARIDRETQVLRDAGFIGLPTTYVQDRRFIGMVSEPELRAALERAQRGDTAQGVPLPAYLLALGLVGAVIVAKGRARERDPRQPA